jgi:hypothetical protein
MSRSLVSLLVSAVLLTAAHAQAPGPRPPDPAFQIPVMANRIVRAYRLADRSPMALTPAMAPRDAVRQ